jgi:hypothetical protein
MGRSIISVQCFFNHLIIPPEHRVGHRRSPYLVALQAQGSTTPGPTRRKTGFHIDLKTWDDVSGLFDRQFGIGMLCYIPQIDTLDCPPHQLGNQDDVRASRLGSWHFVGALEKEKVGREEQRVLR